MAITGFRKREGLTFKETRPPLALPLTLAGLTGLLQSLSWFWPGLWPLCFVVLTPLIIAVDGQSGRRAFLLGWLSGLIMSLSSLSWLAAVLSGYGGLGPLLGWVMLGLLAAFLALYQALWAWLTTLCVASPLLWALMGSAAWCGLDWLKNWVFTGFNWTPLAGPLVLAPELSQAADLVGFYGLGFGVALINFGLVCALFKHREGQRAQARRWLWAVLLLLLADFGYGWHQYGRWETAAAEAQKRRVAVVQPVTDQEIKWDEDYRNRLLARYELLAREAAKLEPWLTLWPETAMPFIYDYDELESEWLRRLGRELGGQMLVGAAGTLGDWPTRKLTNRMLLFQNGQLAAYYDKTHLVPFGEYLPLEGLPLLDWPFVQGLIGAAGLYSPGPPGLPLLAPPLSPGQPTFGQARLGLLICFESIFPYLARERVLAGADLLVVPTNDGWFGHTRAPEQHLWQSAMRAIETRRPLVRAGNTGISALIHPSGRIVWQSRLFETGTWPLETPILNQSDLVTTPFVRGGFFLAPALAILTLALAIIRFFRKQ
jgi:apolipoprotein N-acyltransferase